MEPPRHHPVSMSPSVPCSEPAGLRPGSWNQSGLLYHVATCMGQLTLHSVARSRGCRVIHLRRDGGLNQGRSSGKECSGGFPGGARDKEPTCQRRSHMFPWLGKIPCRRKWQPAPVLLPENPMDRGAWRATVHGVPTSQTRFSD